MDYKPTNELEELSKAIQEGLAANRAIEEERAKIEHMQKELEQRREALHAAMDNRNRLWNAVYNHVREIMSDNGVLVEADRGNPVNAVRSVDIDRSINQYR